VSDPELEPIQPSWDQRKLEQGVHQLGLLYGIRGLEVAVQPGGGWSCAKTEHGLTITVDPQQTVEGNGFEKTADSEPSPVSSEVTSLFITAHELGHANDYLDPSWRKPAKPSPSDDFFNCLVDDTVIDKRNRRVPMLDANADAVYSHQMPSDMTELPKHVQLMFGMRVGTVIDNPTTVMDSRVEEILTSLGQYQKGDQMYDIMDVITDPRTTLTERRRIAERFIKPHFDALLEQDKQEQSGSQEGQLGEGEGDFEAIYEQYEQAVHGHQHQGDGEGEGSEQPTPAQGESTGKTSGGLAEQMAEALKQAAEEQQAKNEANAKAQASRASKADSEGSEQREAQLSELAGTIAAEMHLSPGDAESYVRSLDKWTGTIKEVADVFMKLAAPANVIMSHRYRRDAHTEGVRLHPRTLAGVALQLATDQDQAIWQPIVREAHRQEVTFGGLDVHLLVDVSGSMAGPKAQCAADTAMCLMEGLQLARHKVARTAGQYHQPDVRTQVIAFGSGTEVLSPLSHQPTGQQKGKTYTNLLEADSSATLVNDALGHVKQAAAAKPKRDAIAIIISDGQFGDHNAAARTVAEMPKTAYIAHLVIGGGVQEFISKNHEVVSNPNVLPGKLHGVLADYIRRSQS
jgi:hypothetical protein